MDKNAEIGTPGSAHLNRLGQSGKDQKDWPCIPANAYTPRQGIPLCRNGGMTNESAESRQ